MSDSTYIQCGYISSYTKILISSVQSLSHVQLFVNSWTAAHQAPCPSPTPRVCWNSCPSSKWCHSTTSSYVISFSSCLLDSPRTKVFSNESVHCIRWPKFWRFSFSISPFNEYSRLISFRIDAVQETLKSLLQHHSSKASILWHSVFFILQLSYPYMATGKTIALIRQTSVSAF